MGILVTLLAAAIIFCVIAVFLSVVAVGIGFLLAVCVPSLQLGHGIIAGAIVAASTLFFFCRLVNAVSNDSETDDGIPDDHSVFVLPTDFLHRGPRSSKPKRDKK